MRVGAELHLSLTISHSGARGIMCKVRAAHSPAQHPCAISEGWELQAARSGAEVSVPRLRSERERALPSPGPLAGNFLRLVREAPWRGLVVTDLGYFPSPWGVPGCFSAREAFLKALLKLFS